eukprot:g6106.t1
MRMSKTAVPSDAEETEIADFFNQGRRPSDRHSPADLVDVDIDTLPNLEPYRREVVAQQPITFGHRPLSASRMFNPCTMATSCGIPNGRNPSTSGNVGGRKGWANGTRRGASGTQQRLRLKALKRDQARKSRRTTGLSAPMLKALLRGNNPAAAGVGGHAAAGATAHGGDIHEKYFDPTRSDNQDSPVKSKYLVVKGQEDVSDSSIASGRDRLHESMWGSVDPAGGRTKEDLQATWLTNSSTEGEWRERRGLGGSVEELELRRIFSDERPPWDGTPAPLPAPRNVRRAISSLLMPDPDERLRDKLIKSRKAAAGIPVTASSVKDERDQELRPFNSTPSGRWEACPATPRAVMAREEIKKLSEERRERDSAMAKRVRQAELRVFFNKIAPSEQLYRSTLQLAQERFRHQEAVAA